MHVAWEGKSKCSCLRKKRLGMHVAWEEKSKCSWQDESNFSCEYGKMTCMWLGKLYNIAECGTRHSALGSIWCIRLMLRQPNFLSLSTSTTPSDATCSVDSTPSEAFRDMGTRTDLPDGKYGSSCLRVSDPHSIKQCTHARRHRHHHLPSSAVIGAHSGFSAAYQRRLCLS